MEAAERSEAAREWAKGWPLVISCMLGLSVGAVAPYALGQFMAPLEHAFGWSRTQSSIGLSANLVIGFVMGPLVGRAVDRINARFLALPGLVLSGVAVAAFSLANRSTGLWFLLWAFHAAAGVLVGPVVWTAVIAGAFRASRSLAMAVALAGTALTVTFAPIVARYLIDAYQWRMAWRLLGLIWCGGALLVAVPFFVDRRPRGSHPDAKAARSATPLRELYTSSAFWRLGLVVLGGFAIISALMIHLSPALVDDGFTPDLAAKIAGAAGLAVVLGKLAVGALFDRTSMRVVSVIVLTPLALAAVLFAVMKGQFYFAVTASLLLGASSGAMLTLLACLTARLFKTEDFGAVFGALMSLMAVSGTLGPVLMGAVHDATHAYTAVFWAGVGVAAVCMAVLATLPSRRVSSPIGPVAIEEMV